MDKHLNVDVKDSVKFTANKKHASAYPTQNQAIDDVKKILQKNKQLKARKLHKKSKPPIKLILSCTCLLAMATAAHFYHDQIDSLLSKIEIGAFSQGLAADSKEKAADSKDKKATNLPTGQTTETAAKTKEKTHWTEEEISIFKGLDERKKQLDEKEKNLKALAEELQKQRAELDGKLKKLEDVRANISQTLGEQIEKDEEKLNKLVEVYSNMKPNNAAKVFENIDENLAVDILTRMKKDRAANILNLIEPQKARKLSEKFAGYVRK
jgi:flagellar motility protein MotE (MotC chaperone)